MKVDIETAVDSLVNLVKENKEISLEDASKKLGVPENIVNEWSVFLEEEGILKVYYKVTRPFLKATEDTKRISQEKEDIDTDRDNLIRKVNYVLSGIRTHKIENIKGVKNEEDIRGLLSKKDRTKEEILFAQKFILEQRIQNLILNLKNAKTNQDLERLSKEIGDIEKKRDIFEKDLKK